MRLEEALIFAKRQLANRELSRRLRQAKPPRVALVKQDCNEDLYCCAPDASLHDTVASTLLRSGPVGLFTLFETSFLVLVAENDPECSIWREKCDPLAWAPESWFESFRDHVPGRDHGQSKFSVRAEDVDWGQFDLVVSVDVSVPARITRCFPRVVWAYYVRELKAPSWKRSFERPIEGQDLYLSHGFDPSRKARPPHVVDFPYQFQRPGVFHEVFDGAPAFDAPRAGVFVEYHTAREAADRELEQLEEFGPVFARRREHDRFDTATGERIPHTSMSSPDREALLGSKYHVRWLGRPTFGTSKVEAVASGCVTVGNRSGDGARFINSALTDANDFSALLRSLRAMESRPAHYRRELRRQRDLVEYLCYLRPANELLAAFERVRKEKMTRRN